jgi:glucosylceramidase
MELLEVYPEFRYQSILGIGGAFTESAAYNFSLVSPENQQKIITAFFDKTEGIALNFCRTHIGSCDFSIEQYGYVEDNDVDLKTFSIDRERKYVIPFVKAALAKNPDLLLFASPWSPPAFMKDTKTLIKGGKLLPEYYKTWAKYFSLYLKEFQKEGINFFAVSVQNEPKAIQTWESCFYTGTEEGIFATNYLRPTLNEEGFADTKIIVWDHNKERVMERSREIFAVEGAKDAIWGIGFHWYSGEHFDNLRMAHEIFPDKPLISTEFCLGDLVSPDNKWGDVEAYANEMIGNFNNFTSASVEWNLILDLQGGPYHDRTGGIKAPVYVNAETKELIINNLYYAVGHFSKFVQRDAVRVGTSSYNGDLKMTAFQNPDGTVVVVVLNKSDKDLPAKLRIDSYSAAVTIAAKSLNTFVVQK